MSMKCCSGCKQSLPHEKFSASKSTPDRLQYRCKDCNHQYLVENLSRIKATKRLHYRANRDAILASNKEWKNKNSELLIARRAERYLANREAVVDTSRAWRRANPVAAREQKRRWYSKNQEKAAASKNAHYEANKSRMLDLNRAWRKTNPEKAREIGDRRRARERSAFVEHVDRRVVAERDKGICGICKQKVDEPHASLDHIIPLSKGGKHAYDNVQLAHLRCNTMKNNRIMTTSAA